MNRVKSIEEQLRESMGFAPIKEELPQDVQDKIKANNDKMTQLKKDGAPQAEIDALEKENDELNGGNKTSEAKKLSSEEARLKGQISQLAGNIRKLQGKITNGKKDLENRLYQAKKKFSSMAPEDKAEFKASYKKSVASDKEYQVSARAEMKKMRVEKKTLIDKFKKLRGKSEDLNFVNITSEAKETNPEIKKLTAEKNKLNKEFDQKKKQYPSHAEWVKIFAKDSEKRTPEEKERYTELNKSNDEYSYKVIIPIQDKIKLINDKIKAIKAKTESLKEATKPAVKAKIAKQIEIKANLKKMIVSLKDKLAKTDKEKRGPIRDKLQKLTNKSKVVSGTIKKLKDDYKAATRVIIKKG